MKSTRKFGAGRGTQIYISPSHPSLPPSFPQAITWLHAFQHEDWEWDFFINMSGADIPIVSIPEIEVGREGREGGKEGGLEYGYLFPLFVRSHPSTYFPRFLDLHSKVLTFLSSIPPFLPPEIPRTSRPGFLHQLPRERARVQTNAYLPGAIEGGRGDSAEPNPGK